MTTLPASQPPAPDFKSHLSESLYWIRGVAISLVVIGHVIGFDRNYGMRQLYQSDLGLLGWFGDVINTVHMPTFFVASGLATAVFSRPSKSFKSFFTSKIQRLLVPLFLWSPCYFVFQSIAKGRSFTVLDVLKSAVTPYEIFWFLHALIFAIGLRYLVEKFTSSKMVYLGLSIVLTALSTQSIFSNLSVYWYWNLFFAVGIVGAEPMKQMSHWFQDRSSVQLAGLVIGCMFFLGAMKLIPLSDYSHLMGIRLVNSLPGFTLFYLLFLLSSRLTEQSSKTIAGLHQGIAYVGSMSMAVYLFHGYFTRGSALIFAKLGFVPPIVYFVTLSLAGILAPLVLHSLVFQRHAALAYATGSK